MKEKRPGLSSYYIVYDFLFEDKRLSPLQIHILCLILSFIANDRVCFITNSYLSKRFNRSQASIKKSLSQLVKLGYITRDFDPSKNFRRVLGTYVFDSNLGGIEKYPGGDRKVYPYNKVYNTIFTKVNIEGETPKSFAFRSVNKRRPVLNIPRIQRKKPNHLENASPEAAMIIRKWNKYSCGVHHKRMDTKTIKETIQYLDNIALKRYSLKRILKAMRDYVYMRNNPQSFKISPRKISIHSFFITNRFVKESKRNKGYSQDSTAYFTRIVKKKDLRDFHSSRDKYPNTTRRLMNFYRKHVLVENDIEYTEKQKYQFRRGAEMLHQYMKKKRLEKYIENATIDTYVRMLFRAISWHWGEKIAVHLVCSKYTYNDTLPKYLSEEFET